MSANNPGTTLEQLLKNQPPWKKKPKPKPILELAASRDREPDEQNRIASVPLEPEDVQTVREALSHRRMMIGGDEVGFDKVTAARVTMRWCRPTPVIDRADAKVVSAYDPYARERMPGYRGDDQ
jgi:hypothetical protein